MGDITGPAYDDFASPLDTDKVVGVRDGAVGRFSVGDLYPPGTVLGAWFGMVGDGATDDTAALQAALDWLGANGGGTLILPEGVSKIAGPLRDTSASNAQVILPKTSTIDAAISITIRGSRRAAFTADPAVGSILQSTLTAGPGWLMGVKGAGAGNSFISLYIDGVTFRLPQDSAIGALDCGYVHYSEINARFDVPNAFDANGYCTITSPSHPTNVALRCPLNNIAAGCLVNVAIMGYRVGLNPGELVAGRAQIGACLYPVLVQTGQHASKLDYLLVTNSPNTIYMDGYYAEFYVDLLNIEHDTVAGSGPSWVEPFGYDIDDSGNRLRGGAIVQMHDTNIPFAMNGGVDFRVEKLGVQPAAGYGVLCASWTTITDATSSRQINANPGKQAVLPLLATQTTTAGGPIGGVVWANNSAAGPDYRVASVTVSLDGALDSGGLDLATSNAGTLAVRWTINKYGQLISAGGLQNAADDAAAAALTPAVPVKGLYRNGSVVMIRVS